MAHNMFNVRQSSVINVDCIGTQVIDKYFMFLFINELTL